MSDNSAAAGVKKFLVSSRRGLSHYYELKKNSPKVGIARPVDGKKHDYSFLKDVKGTTLCFGSRECTASRVLRLLEKLPEILPGVERSRLNMGTAVLGWKSPPESTSRTWQ